MSKCGCDYRTGGRRLCSGTFDCGPRAGTGSFCDQGMAIAAARYRRDPPAIYPASLSWVAAVAEARPARVPGRTPVPAWTSAGTHGRMAVEARAATSVRAHSLMLRFAHAWGQFGSLFFEASRKWESAFVTPSRSERCGRIGTAILTPVHFSLATGHFRSSIASKALDARGKPLPWYTYPGIDFLCGVDFSGQSCSSLVRASPP